MVSLRALMCGFISIFGPPASNAIHDVINRLLAVQHRGQDAAGVVTFGDRFQAKKGLGLVRVAEHASPGTVDLLPANRPSRISLRMLAPDGTPLKREYWSAGGKEQVDTENTVHAYEMDGKFVEVTDEELEELAPEKTREIDLRLFVDKDELDPVFFERAYFLAHPMIPNDVLANGIRRMQAEAKATMELVREKTGLAYSLDLFADQVDIFGEYDG